VWSQFEEEGAHGQGRRHHGREVEVRFGVRGSAEGREWGEFGAGRGGLTTGILVFA
jgi:hypothetical protein